MPTSAQRAMKSSMPIPFSMKPSVYAFTPPATAAQYLWMIAMVLSTPGTISVDDCNSAIDHALTLSIVVSRAWGSACEVGRLFYWVKEDTPHTLGVFQSAGAGLGAAALFSIGKRARSTPRGSGRVL